MTIFNWMLFAIIFFGVWGCTLLVCIAILAARILAALGYSLVVKDFNEHPPAQDKYMHVQLKRETPPDVFFDDEGAL